MFVFLQITHYSENIFECLLSARHWGYSSNWTGIFTASPEHTFNEEDKFCKCKKGFVKALEGTGGPLECVALLGQSASGGAGGLLESVGS